MIFAVLLIVLALLVSWPAGTMLARARWASGNPGTAVICWASLIVGVPATLIGVVSLALLWPPAPGHELLERLHVCLDPHEHGRPGPTWAALGSIILMALCSIRLSRGLPRLWRAVFHRRRHRDLLRVIAREDDRHPDVLVLDHPIPVAYCLPAPRRPIVVSTGAKRCLDADELAAVLAHERAHLRQRHHLLLMLLDLAYALTPWSPSLRRARASVPMLLEMAADDVAARRCGRHALARALRRLVPAPGPAGAMAATGPLDHMINRRLARLDRAAERPRRGLRALGWATAFCTATGPLAIFTLAVASVPLPC